MKRYILIFLAIILCMSVVTVPASAEQPIVIQDDDIFLNVGETAKLSALVESGASVTWSGGSTGIATVSADGVVTAVGKGACHVYASLADGTKTAVLVQVKEKTSSLLATATGLELRYDINEQQLHYTIKYSGTIMPNQRLSIKLYSTEKKNGAWVYDSFFSFNNPLFSELDISDTEIKGSIRLGKASYTGGSYKDFALDICGEEVIGSSGTSYTTLSCVRAYLESTPLGDINGDGLINPFDASLALRYDAALISAAPNGDVSNDGVVDSFDAYLILCYDAGLIGSFDAWKN